MSLTFQRRRSTKKINASSCLETGSLASTWDRPERNFWCREHRVWLGGVSKKRGVNLYSVQDLFLILQLLSLTFSRGNQEKINLRPVKTVVDHKSGGETPGYRFWIRRSTYLSLKKYRGPLQTSCLGNQ